MVTYLLKLLASYIPWKPNTPVNEITTLDGAIGRYSLSIAHELIKNGADINKVDKNGSTILCDAVYYRQSEAICMLLYYGADLEFAKLMIHGGYIDPNLLSIADEDFRNVTKTLMNYCTVTDGPDIETYCQELITTYSVIGIFLLENEHSDTKLAELFLLIIPQLNPSVIINFEKPLLLIYLQSCDFSTSNWLKCLHMILELPFAVDLMQHFVFFTNGRGCFSDLICAFKDRRVERRDRTVLIWTWLSLGAVVNIYDIITAIMDFGYNEEFEAFIYGFNSHKTRNTTALPAIINILALEDNYNFAYSILSSRYLYLYYDAQQTILKLLKFFALSKPMKQQVLIKCQVNFNISCTALSQKFEMLDNCPSLAELSRNQIRRTIKNICVIKQPYEFYETTKSLNIPEKIKDIILFKEPIYKL